MKSKIFKILSLVFALVLIFGTVSTYAYESYATYTYSIDGQALKSPPAYTSTTAAIDSNKMGLISGGYGSLSNSTDLVTDVDGNVYIVDKGNNRIVVLDKYYKVINVISSYVDSNDGFTKTLNAPEGIFVTNPEISADGSAKQIYVCDTQNMQIVVFDEHYNHIRTIERPSSDILQASAFKPSALAVDLYGRIFVISQSCYEGVIVLSSDGEFTGFVGAQQVSVSPIQKIWNDLFQTREERENAVLNISKPYNNITISEDGFIYVTINDSDNASGQFAAISTKTSTYSPVKKFNASGTEIMKRNGFFDCGGEVDVTDKTLSRITDVAVGPEGTWTILDHRRARFFTYDQNGNLLFAFGDNKYNEQLGNGENIVSVTYHEVDGVTYLISLERSATGDKITVYTPTEYCNTILAALKNENDNNYSESIDYWQEVLKQNNNFDLAYIGMGKAYYSQGDYEMAKEMLSAAYETEYFSKAISEIRKKDMGIMIIPTILIVLVLCYGLARFMGWAKKKNKATSLKVGRKTYVEELVYTTHLVFHPFDGFWDLKHEKRGSVRGGLTILLLTIVAFAWQAIGQGYVFNPRGNGDVFVQVIAVLVPVALWVVSNWCLTTLFDGEGSFKDILISTCYSLAPLPIFVALSVILSNILTLNEGGIVTLLVSIGYVWVGILLFFGTMVTHDYSMNKNVLTILGTIVAMIIIIFVILLFSNLVVKMATFVVSIITEIMNRV